MYLFVTNEPTKHKKLVPAFVSIVDFLIYKKSGNFCFLIFDSYIYSCLFFSSYCMFNISSDSGHPNLFLTLMSIIHYVAILKS